MVVSASMHDFEHPGHTNQFAVVTGLEAAHIYNDQAVRAGAGGAGRRS